MDLREKLIELLNLEGEMPRKHAEHIADRILAIPEIAEALMEYWVNRGVVYLPKEDVEAYLAAKEKPNLGHSIRVRDPAGLAEQPSPEAALGLTQRLAVHL